MPELPDVEVFRRYADATCLSQKITQVDIQDASILESPPESLRKLLCGGSFRETARIGKHLFLRASDRGWLMLHFGMTGHLDYGKGAPEDAEHTRLEVGFEGGYRLSYINVRRLGKIDVADSPGDYARSHDLGPDALEVAKADFGDRLRKHRGSVKGVLLNQSVVAGIGNIYADEVLFQAGIDPRRPAADLSEEACGELWRVMRRVCRVAVRHHADPTDLPRGYLLPQREEGAPCPGDCGGAVEKIRVSGRPTYLCPECQSR